MTSHELYMDLALQNAKAIKGQTDPNPLVGSVIVNKNRVVGIGTHLMAGEPHAEIHALRMAGEKARGGTIYVTLEPCSHHGRTGPCAVAIREAGLKKVVIATLDPNPLVSGSGVKILKEAGIEVIIGIRQEESRKMNEVFNKFIVQRTPFITLKAGITLDGTLDYSGSKPEESALDVYHLRNENMAVLVGVNTIMKDNPDLTARIPNGRNPVRVILDTYLDIPFDSKVIVDGKAETWIFTGQEVDSDKEKKLLSEKIKVIRTNGSKSLEVIEVVKILGKNLISSLLIEGDGIINASFLEKQLINKVVLFFAPKLVGVRDTSRFLECEGISMRNEVELSDIEIIKKDKGFRLTGYPKYHK